MSSEFENKKLREVIELVIDNRGKNPKEYSFDGIPVIDNYLITSDGEVNLNEVNRFIDESTYNLFLRKYIQFGDVLMTLVGNGYGKVAITPQERCAIIQNTVGFRCNTDNINKFLYYLLKNNREVFMNLNRGAAQPSIKVGDILDQEFQFPSKEAQESISSILGALDDRIALLRETNATLEAIAQALFKSWFVDFDPVHAKARGEPPQGMDDATAALFPDSFEQSELGMIPKGWILTSLGEVCSYLNRGLSPKYLDEGGVIVINQKCIRDFTIDLCKARRHDPSQRKISGRELCIGDVLVNSTGVGTLGRVAQVLNLTETTIVDSHVTVVRAGETINPSFLGLQMFRLQPQIEAMGEGSTGQTELSRSKLAEMKLIVPSTPILDALESIIAPLKKKIATNSTQAQTLAQLRDTLLPKLISGQLRLPEAEALLAEELP